VKFHTTIHQDGNNTGIVVPEEIIAQLGAGKRPPVRVTLNGYTYRNTVAVMGGKYMISVSKDVREKSGVKGGDELEVELELDTEPREVTVPADLAAALEADPAAKRFFDGLSYSRKSWHVLQVEGTKNPETRQRRVEKSVQMCREGKVP
jgi:antitoxin component of MazEF toxin-antitoxin module